MISVLARAIRPTSINEYKMSGNVSRVADEFHPTFFAMARLRIQSLDHFSPQTTHLSRNHRKRIVAVPLLQRQQYRRRATILSYSLQKVRTDCYRPVVCCGGCLRQRCCCFLSTSAHFPFPRIHRAHLFCCSSCVTDPNK